MPLRNASVRPVSTKLGTGNGLYRPEMAVIESKERPEGHPMDEPLSDLLPL